MKIVTVPPRTWTSVGFGLEVWHDYGAARTVELFGGGAAQLVGEWQVRAASVQQTPTPRPAPHVVEHRTLGGRAEAFERPVADPFGPPSRTAPDGDWPGPVFVAQFMTQCPECGGDIEEGEEARMTPDGAAHAGCVEPDDGTSYADGVPS